MPINAKISSNPSRQGENHYADPRTVNSVDDCFFYHAIDLPDFGEQKGQWDLRKGVGEYLADGHLDWNGKRVLELGAASGYVTSQLEKRGAEVVSVDLNDQLNWDLVPFPRLVSEETFVERRAGTRRLNNAWWMTHSQLKLKARKVYARAYDVPLEVGPFDVAYFGSILQHLRDPFLALEHAARFGPNTIVVTDAMPAAERRYTDFLGRVFCKLTGRSNFFYPDLKFVPSGDTQRHEDTWWRISPPMISQFLGVLGYSKHRVLRHTQFCVALNRAIEMYTIVGIKK